MTINDKTLENLSKLSKIKIDDNLRDKLKEDLNLTMNMIDEINKIDCDQIEDLILLSDHTQCYSFHQS